MDKRKKILLVIAPENFQDHEYQKTKEVLEKNGIETVTASKISGRCRGASGAEVEAELKLEDVDFSEFDGLAVIGGGGCPKAYFDDPQIIELIRGFNDQKKIVSAVCIAPIVLAQSGILAGKKATVWNEDGKWGPELEKHGAEFVDEQVVADGNVITGNGPNAAEEFGEAIAKKIKE